MITTIKNVRVFDGERMTEPQDVSFDNGIIVANPENVGAAIDGTGLSLLPGFIDTHIHIDSRENCVLAAKAGITTLIDQMCNKTELIDSLKEPDEPIASVRSAYMPVQSENGLLMILALGHKSEYAASKEDVHRMIDREIAKGAIVVKLILDVPPLTKGMLEVELVAETVRYAHERGKLVSAHCTTMLAYERAVKCGVDILNHIPKDSPMPQDIIDSIKAKNLTVIPTMVMQRGLVRNMKRWMPRRAGDFANVVETVRRMHEAGIKLLVGTDSNNTNALCHIKHGESIWQEFELLHEAGLTYLEILRATTCEAAKVFGLSDRGSIGPGKRADLVLVEGNPLEDITAVRNIKQVFVKGKLR